MQTRRLLRQGPQDCQSRPFDYWTAKGLYEAGQTLYAGARGVAAVAGPALALM